MKKIQQSFILFFAWIISFYEGKAQSSDQDFLYQIGEKHIFFSEILNEERDYWIQLPANAQPYEKFPVVYILDGGVHLGALATVQEYYWGHQLPRMILVGISNRTNRTRDLTTSMVQMGDWETGKAEQFTQFIAKELIPHIDENYPTTPYRTLIGHSYGGLFVVNTLLHHSELFANYIAIDPSLDWDDQKLIRDSEKHLSNQQWVNKSLFMTIAGPLDRADESLGIDEIMASDSETSVFSHAFFSFVRNLESNSQTRITLDWKHYLSDTHSSVPLPSILDGMIRLFDWYPMEHISEINNPETSPARIGELLELHSNKLNQHLGYSAPVADEDMLNMGGYMFLQMGQTDKAGIFFEWSVDSYPESPNAHDSLAEYYHLVGRKQDAIEQLELAFEMSGDLYYQEKIAEIRN